MPLMRDDSLVFGASICVYVSECEFIGTTKQSQGSAAAKKMLR